MRRTIGLLSIVLLVAFGGCPTDNSGGSINFTGELNATDSSFRLDGRVVNSGYADVTHQNVSVSLFTANGTKNGGTDVGTLQRSANVTLTADTVPKYVIINAPTFWQYDDIDVSYYEFEGGGYSQSVVGSREELPVQPPG